MPLPVRKHPRLKEYDYSSNGVYFVTICTKNRIDYLSEIVGRDDPIPPQSKLTEFGKITDKYIKSIGTSYKNIFIENYIIMPNHIHLLIFIDVNDEIGGGIGSSRPTLNKIIKAFKRLVTNEIGFSIWQESFYDEIVRNEKAFQQIWDYIESNPSQWLEDKENINKIN